MRTFSEIIDIIVNTAKVPHKIPYVVVQANGIVRDLRTNHASDFDLAETQLLPLALDATQRGCECRATHVEWMVPCDFRAIRAVRYNGCEYVPNRKPGLIQKRGDNHWYQSGDYIVFSGNPQCIDISFYTMPRSYIYFDPKKRRIKSCDQCQYLVRQKHTSETPDDPALLWQAVNFNFTWHKVAYSQQVDWIIREYYDVVMNGTLAAIYNGMGDVARGSRYYQQFVQGKKQISRNRETHLEAEL